MGKKTAAVLSVLFLFFNFALPKAGTKIGEIPLYVSLILALTVFIILSVNLLKDHKKRENQLFLLYALSFVLICVLNYIVYPMPVSFKAFALYQMPYLTGLSAALFFFFSKYMALDLKIWKNILFVSFILVTLYGILQKVFGDMNVIIPGITFNYSEAVKLGANAPMNIWGKYNFIGGIGYLKLSSTYQNGNLFGVNYILFSWFLFYFLLKGNTVRNKILFFISLIFYIVICLLTASSTVYFGLIFSIICYFCFLLVKTLKSGEKNRYAKFFTLLSIPVLLIVSIAVLSLASPIIRDILAAKLWGRDLLGNERVTSLLAYCGNILETHDIYKFLFGSFFHHTPGAGAYEIVIASVFVNFGILFALFCAVLVFLIARKLKFTVYNIGIAGYLFMSFFDGGFWLPPTAITFFTLLGLSYFVLNKQETSFDAGAARNGAGDSTPASILK